MPAEEGFAVIDAEIEIMAGQVDGQLEQFVMGELADEAAAACINGKEIEIVPEVVRVFFRELPDALEESILATRRVEEGVCGHCYPLAAASVIRLWF